MASLSQINIKFAADLRDFSSQMENVSRSMKGFGDKLKGVGASLSVGITAPLLALGALATKTAANFETLNTSLLTAFNGNEAAAKSAFDQITKFAASTPFQVEQVADAFIKLKNLGLDPSERALTSYGNTASAMGKELNQVIEAVADASTGEFERLKEFGIKSKQEGDRVIFTFKGVETTVDKSASAIQEYLLNIGETDFAGGMERQSKTFLGQFSTLKDNLALIGKEIGDIILAYLKPFVVKIQELTQRFKDLEPATKKTIVVIAAIAAAIGPVLVSLGFLVGNVLPGLVTAFGAVRAAILAFNLVLIANPITAMVAAIGILVSLLAAYTISSRKAADATTFLDGIRKKALDSVVQERAKLESLLVIARDELVSKEQRLKAIGEINKISPKYLGDLTLEKINTDSAREAIEKYNKELLKTALIKAAQEKLVELQAKIIDLELKGAKARTNAINKELIAEQARTLARKNGTTEYFEQQKLLKGVSGALIEVYKKQSQELLTIITNTDDLTVSTAAAEEGTKKLARGTAELVGSLTKLGPVLKSVYDTGAGTGIKSMAADFDEAAARAIYVANTLNDAFAVGIKKAASSFLQGMGSILAGFAQGINGAASIGNLMLQVMGDLLINLGQIAIETAVGLIAIQAAFRSLNPAIAAAAGVALIAFGTLIKSKVQNTPGNVALANGGVVFGETLSLIGDNRNAAFDPEVVSPLSKLKEFIQPEQSASNIQVGIDGKISGYDLELIISRVIEKKARRG